ncbi:MAG: hypothetical protein ACR2P5_07980 [Gammaproteobacteria bacterium]
MSLLEILRDGLRKVSQAYLAHPEFTPADYRGMAVQYLLSALLIALGEDGDCGHYEHPESHGWVGWVTVGDCTLFFAPTEAVILCGDERSRFEDEDNISPIGNI